MGTTVSFSSPEPEELSKVERALHILSQHPLNMGSMLRLSRMINECSVYEKLQLVQTGVLRQIITMIADRTIGVVDTQAHKSSYLSVANASPVGDRKSAAAQGSSARNLSVLKSGTASNNNRNNFVTQITTAGRRKSTPAAVQRGIGYGFGSTKSHWDIERTIEEIMIREEQLVWLLNALTAYLFCASPDFSDVDETYRRNAQRDFKHITAEVVSLIRQSTIVPLFEYHIKNESLFDVSEHMEFYQALLETVCSMSLCTPLADLVVFHAAAAGGRPVGTLTTTFCTMLNNYVHSANLRIGSPDFRIVDFVQKVERYCRLINVAAQNAMARAATARNTLTATSRQNSAPPSSDGSTRLSGSVSSMIEPEQQPDLVPEDKEEKVASSAALVVATEEDPEAAEYINAMKAYQITNWKFIGDFGKLVVPFTYRKEAKSLNPFSPSLKERTRRISRELASLQNALPLNTSNSIFICVDEGRCDIMKVLITGPDDTPYQNGCFEFDLFFPSTYPFSPPKVTFLTTGAGEVRFNPNLYQDGKVCLSILNTWEGRPEEKWNPYCSLLQVLVSIQALIFVKEPYFNEPGFERYVGTEKGNQLSTIYNQQLQHATMHYAILEQIRHPSEYFRDVIRRHFAVKKEEVADQIRKWLRQMQADQQTSAKDKSADKKNAMASDVTMNLGVVSVKSAEKTSELLLGELEQLTISTPE